MPKPYALFYHVWCTEDLFVSRFIVDEQLKRIARSGLPNHCDVICCINGVSYEQIKQFISTYDWVTIKVATPDESRFEGLTLEHLYDHCKSSPHLQGVAYVHTKGMRDLATGAPDQRFRAVNSWRHFLEWGTIDRWRDAVSLLGRYDATGVNLRDRPWRHFSGNFWWAKPDYIKQLIKPTIGTFPEGDYSFVVQTGPIRQVITNRLDFERWLGLNDPNCFSFYGYPFMENGKSLPPDFHNLYENDIECYYRSNGI